MIASSAADIFRVNTRFFWHLGKIPSGLGVRQPGRLNKSTILYGKPLIVALFCHSGVLGVMGKSNTRENLVLRLARVLASGLILNATFPVDILAQATRPLTAVTQSATAQPFNA